MQFREAANGFVESVVVESYIVEDAGRLADPVIRAFDTLWRGQDAAGRLPGRQHIDLDAVAGLLPHIMLVDVIEGTRGYRFKARLVGQHHVGMTGRNSAGEYLGEAPYAAAIATGMPHYSRHQVDRSALGPYRFERVVYPLASNGTDVDRLAVVVVPHFPAKARAASFFSWF